MTKSGFTVRSLIPLLAFSTACFTTITLQKQTAQPKPVAAIWTINNGPGTTYSPDKRKPWGAIHLYLCIRKAKQKTHWKTIKYNTHLLLRRNRVYNILTWIQLNEREKQVNILLKCQQKHTKPVPRRKKKQLGTDLIIAPLNVPPAKTLIVPSIQFLRGSVAHLTSNDFSSFFQPHTSVVMVSALRLNCCQPFSFWVASGAQSNFTTERRSHSTRGFLGFSLFSCHCSLFNRALTD